MIFGMEEAIKEDYAKLEADNQHAQLAYPRALSVGKYWLDEREKPEPTLEEIAKMAGKHGYRLVQLERSKPQT